MSDSSSSKVVFSDEDRGLVEDTGLWRNMVEVLEGQLREMAVLRERREEMERKMGVEVEDGRNFDLNQR